MNFPTDGTPFSTSYLFRPLSQAEASALDTIAVGQLAVPANRDLVRTGEVGGHMMLLLDGWCFRYRQRSDGRRFILEILLPGDMIGLQAGVLGITDHAVRALTAARTKLIDGRRLDELYRAQPEFTLA